MAPLPLMFLCLCLISRIKCEVQSENSPNTYQNKDNDVNAVLNYLNSYSFKVYNYKEATLLSAHTKADITELVLEINVDCINKYPDLPCSEKVLTCHAFVRNTPEGGSQILNDVSCKPRPTVIIDEPSPSNPSEAEITYSKSISLSNEAASSEVVEPFVAVKKNAIPCLGCPFDLNPNAEGVDELVDLALQHVESERQNKHALIKILKLQQQVVSGVKYILVAELAPTTCQKNSYDLSVCPIDGASGTYVCEILYLQKPWISKAKHIIGNNCTVSQEFVKSKNEISNEIDGKHVAPGTTPDFDNIAENGGAEQMSSSRLSDLESQIIVDEVQPMQSTKSVEEMVPSVVPLPEITDSFQTDETQPEVVPSNEPISTDQEFYESTLEGTTETTVQEDSRIHFEEKNREKRAIPQLEKISHEERPLVKNLADFAASALDNIDDDNHKRIILQILGAKKMVGDDGVYYHLIMRMGVSRCLEDKPNLFENCREKLIENYTKICKVQVFVNDDFGSPKIVKSQCQNIKRDKNDNNKTNYGRYKRHTVGDFDINENDIREKREVAPGGEFESPKDDIFVERYLEDSLAKLDEKSKHENKYKVEEIISSTSQVVSGHIYRIRAKIALSECKKTAKDKRNDCNTLQGAESKICDFVVFEKTWVANSRVTNVTCGEEVHTFSQRQKRETERVALGGESQISKDDENVKKYLEASLAKFDQESSDKNKVKVDEFLSATKQVVAGHVYKIKAKIVQSDCDKSSNKERHVCGVLEGAEAKTCRFEVFVGLNKNRKIDIYCDARQKRQASGENDIAVPGGQTSINKDSDNVKKLLNEGITHLNAKWDKNNKYKPIKVLSATSQVVAGSLTRIQTKIAETKCAKTDDKKLEDCEVTEGAAPKKCEVKIWEKPWENFKQYTVECEKEQKYTIEVKTNKKKREVYSFRQKREIPVLGGESQASKDDESVKKYLEASLTKLDQESSDNNKVKVHEFLSATKQVVAGFVYRIKAKVVQSDCEKSSNKERHLCGVLEGAEPKTCRFEVFEGLNNNRKIDIDCGSRKKRNNNLKVKGGQTEIDKNSEKVKTLLNEGITHLNAKWEKDNKYKPIEVLSATSQTVAGSLYRIQTKIAETKCAKTDDKNLEDCEVTEGATPTKCEVKIWEKPWENFKQYTVECEGEQKITTEVKTNKNKREVAPGGEIPIFGGESQADENNESVKKYLEASLVKLDQESSEKNKAKVHEFISATKQVVAGFVYRIKAKIVQSDCEKSSNKERHLCGVLEGAEPKTCRFEVFEGLNNNRKIEIDCGTRKKRQASREHDIRIVGGQSNIDKNSEKVKKLLNEGITHLNARWDKNNKYKPIEVLSATSQVVAGSLTRIQTNIAETKCAKADDKNLEDCEVKEGAAPKKCEVKIWEKPWENFKQYTVECEKEQKYTIEVKTNKKKREVYSFRQKREIPVLGGESQASKDDESVKKYLEASLTKLDQESNDKNKVKVHEFLSATKQVVAGFVYRIKAKVVQSDCEKSSSKERHLCGVLEGAEPKTCHFEVFEGLNNNRKIEIDCGTRKKRQASRENDIQIFGGESSIDKNSENVKKLLNEGITHLNAKWDKNNKYKPIEVLSATSQVVAGSLTRIQTKIAETKCAKTDDKNLEDCEVKEGAASKKCEVKIWEKSWENFKQYTVECEKEQKYTIEVKTNKKKRELAPGGEIPVLGGESQAHEDDESVKKYLEASLVKFDQQSSDKNKAKVHEFISATKQVVAGFIYKIKAKIVQSDCEKSSNKERHLCGVLEGAEPKTCRFEVFEGLNNNRKIDIDCGTRKKRQASREIDLIVGGESDIDKNSEKVKKLLFEGITHLNSKWDKNNKYKPIEVLSATSQVVAGSLTRIQTNIAETKCAKTDDKNLEDCEVTEGASPKKCEVKIWEKTWENFKQYTVECEKEQKYTIEVKTNKKKRELAPGGEIPVLGGESQAHEDDESVKKYLEASLVKFDQQSSDKNKAKVHEFLSATKQVVAGFIYKIKAKIVQSDCEKSSNKERHLCGVLEGAEPKTCRFEVFEGLNNNRKVEIDCGSRKKRQLYKEDLKAQFELFNDFVKKHQKKYKKKEYKRRFEVFKENLFRIRLLNTYEQGTATYGITKFADLTHSEFSKKLGLRPDLRNENEAPFPQAKIPNIDLPTEFDWRQKGAVTEVKNQEQCGSCWAFSVTGNVEGQYALKHGQLLEFSEQELVDCDSEDQGCNGGLMDTAYRQIEKLGGLETEQDYPYDAEDEKCHFNRSLARVQLSGALNISHDETDMAKWLVANGPISIAINANAMQFYMGGVSHPFKFLCSPSSLDHGVLIVGYGVHTYPLFKKTLPYWIVKNSWGTSWGEQGYYRVYRGDGTCGLNQTPSSAIVV